jgi:SAM-dependent methyltransferase
MVGPFADDNLFRSSGERAVADIADLCALRGDHRVLEIGCGCGRLALPLMAKLAPAGSYDGFDVVRAAVDWCRDNVTPRAGNFRFRWVDVAAAAHNPDGTIDFADVAFPYPDDAFDLAIMSSVVTHMRPEGIERYVRETFRVLKPGGRCFITALLFDQAAARAVAAGTTIFDFRHALGPCLTFDPACPETGIACRDDWFFGLLTGTGFAIESVRRGNWRDKRSYEITHDDVVARKPA